MPSLMPTGRDRRHEPENGTPESTLTASWYVVRTRSRHEKRVWTQLLERQMEVFLPTYWRWSQWKDRKVRVELPLFPGYLFAHFPLAERIRVLTVPGVAHLVRLNGHPEPVPAGEICGIRRLVESHFEYDPHPFLTEGMQVEVVRGPLAGVRGRLIRKDRIARLVLAVTLIHQAAAVEIHPADIVPV